MNSIPPLPMDLQTMLEGYIASENNVGCTLASVFRYQKDDDALYLKIQKINHEIHREHELLLWLQGKLPIPEVKYWAEKDGYAYLLTTEVSGRMTCDCPEDTVAKPVEKTIKLLAEGLLMLQAVDISDCPFENTLDKKLIYALDNIKNDLVDMDDWNDDNNFNSPMELYEWLSANKPAEDLYFVHGDYCLPNIFINDKSVTGFIDIGRGGIADRWLDIALCVRSLGYNLRDMEKAERDKNVELLFTHLGFEPDWNKINYYILLDELF